MERYNHWLSKGAKASDRIQFLVKKKPLPEDSALKSATPASGQDGPTISSFSAGSPVCTDCAAG